MGTFKQLRNITASALIGLSALTAQKLDAQAHATKTRAKPDCASIADEACIRHDYISLAQGKPVQPMTVYHLAADTTLEGIASVPQNGAFNSRMETVRGQHVWTGYAELNNHGRPQAVEADGRIAFILPNSQHSVELSTYLRTLADQAGVSVNGRREELTINGTNVTAMTFNAQQVYDLLGRDATQDGQVRTAPFVLTRTTKDCTNKIPALINLYGTQEQVQEIYTPQEQARPQQEQRGLVDMGENYSVERAPNQEHVSKPSDITTQRFARLYAGPLAEFNNIETGVASDKSSINSAGIIAGGEIGIDASQGWAEAGLEASYNKALQQSGDLVDVNSELTSKVGILRADAAFTPLRLSKNAYLGIGGALTYESANTTEKANNNLEGAFTENLTTSITEGVIGPALQTRYLQIIAGPAIRNAPGDISQARHATGWGALVHVNNHDGSLSIIGEYRNTTGGELAFGSERHNVATLEGRLRYEPLNRNVGLFVQINRENQSTIEQISTTKLSAGVSYRFSRRNEQTHY